MKCAVEHDFLHPGIVLGLRVTQHEMEHDPYPVIVDVFDQRLVCGILLDDDPAQLHVFLDRPDGLFHHQVQLIGGAVEILSRHLVQQLRSQLMEHCVSCHEIRFACELQQDALVRQNPGKNLAAVGDPVALLHRRGEALLFEQTLGLVEVTTRLDQRVLAVQHSRPGFLPEPFYIGCLDFHRPSLYSLYSLSSSISGSSMAGAFSSFFASSGL